MPHISPPEGESFDDQIRRITAWCTMIEKYNFTRPQIIFTHAGTIRALISYMMDMPSLKAQAIAINHFGYLQTSLMDAVHAKLHNGGAWQIHALSSVTG
jgi:broad specificity phosphatase PhoE